MATMHTPDTLNPSAPAGHSLAGIDRRILAKLIDSFVTGTAFLPMIVFFIYDILQAPDPIQPGVITWTGVGISVLVMVFITLYQIYLLIVRSQTLGKKWMNIQIANAKTGQPANLLESLVLRTVVSSLITFIPVIGWIYVIADSLFLFRSDRRCIHDLIAGTQVIELPV